MDQDENRAAVRAAFDAWIAGTAPITDLFAPAMTWRIEGRSVVASQSSSTRQFVDEVLAPFGARFSQGERFRPVDIRATYCDGDTVIVLWDGHGVANDGVPYDNSYVWIMRLDGGKVVEASAFFDSIAFDDLWGRVQPG